MLSCRGQRARFRKALDVLRIKRYNNWWSVISRRASSSRRPNRTRNSTSSITTTLIVHPVPPAFEAAPSVAPRGRRPFPGSVAANKRARLAEARGVNGVSTALTALVAVIVYAPADRITPARRHPRRRSSDEFGTRAARATRDEAYVTRRVAEELAALDEAAGMSAGARARMMNAETQRHPRRGLNAETAMVSSQRRLMP